jgi:hypothetical protein
VVPRSQARPPQVPGLVARVRRSRLPVFRPVPFQAVPFHLVQFHRARCRPA